MLKARLMAFAGGRVLPLMLLGPVLLTGGTPLAQDTVEDSAEADPLDDPLLQDPLLDDPLADGGDEDDVLLPNAPAMVEGLRPDANVVMTGEELRLRGYRTLGEALRDVVGISRQHTTRYVRYGMRGIPDGLALEIDGVPQLIDGERDLLLVDRDLDLDDVERVEIVRGPASALSGVSALSGLVRVTTRRPGLTSARVRLGGSMIGAPSGDTVPGADGPVLGQDVLGGLSTSGFASTLGPFGLPSLGGMIFAERTASGDATFRVGDVGVLLIAQGREGPSRTWRLRGVPLSYFRLGGGVLPGARQDVVALSTHEKSANVRAAISAKRFSADVSYVHVTETVPVSRLSHGLIADTPDVVTRDRLRLRMFYDDELGPLRVSVAAWGAQHLRHDEVHVYPSRGAFPVGGQADVASEVLTGGARLRLDLFVTENHRVSGGLYGDLSRLDASADAIAPGTGTESLDLVTFQELAGTASGAVEYAAAWGYGIDTSVGLAVRLRTGFLWSLQPRASVAWTPWSWLSLRGGYAEGSRAPDRYDVTALSPILISGQALRAGENLSLAPEHARTLEVGLRLSPSARLHLDTALFGTRHESAVESAIQGVQVVPVNLDPRHVVGAEAVLGLELVAGLLRTELAGWGAVNVWGPDLGSDFVRLHAMAELTPSSWLVVGARARALWGISDTAAAGPSGTADLYAALLAFDGGLRVLVGAQNLLDAVEPSPDLAALPGAVDLAIPAPGRTLTLAIEGRL